MITTIINIISQFVYPSVKGNHIPPVMSLPLTPETNDKKFKQQNYMEPYFF